MNTVVSSKRPDQMRICFIAPWELPLIVRKLTVRWFIMKRRKRIVFLNLSRGDQLRKRKRFYSPLAVRIFRVYITDCRICRPQIDSDDETGYLLGS